MNQVEKSVVIALCAKFGKFLATPPGIDGPRIMAAIAGNESSFGSDCVPRHEPSYDRGGSNYRNEQVGLVEQYGSTAACSYGPWQTMPCNALAYSPAELFANPEFCAIAFVAFFNNFVISFRHASTVAEIGEVYNSGHIAPDPGYVSRLEANYARAALPAPSPLLA